MDWADEHYVKLFTRDTVTWLSWPWQARCLFPLLMRKLEHAGILRVGTHEPARATALLVGVPEEVVKPGLEALLADGTVELTAGALIVPKFNEAQETRKTNAQSKREQREKAKSLARASKVAEIAKSHRQTAADGGRSGHPPAQPSPTPAQPDLKLLPPAAAPPAAGKRSPAKVDKPPDPRHVPLVARLDEVFRTKRGAKYPFDGRAAKTVQRLLQRRADPGWPEELAAAWARALDARYPECKSLEDFDRDLPRYLGATGPPSAAKNAPATGLEGSGPLTATEGFV